MVKVKALFTLVFTSFLTFCNNPNADTAINTEEIFPTPTNQVVLSSEIEWEALNPARGDQSPKAGTIWGDRNGDVATGFLAKFVDGFASPPHIHNVTYRAMVLKGFIHNDDPNAEKMWMPAGSFWTQPAGAVHITAAKGAENIAYVEIDSAPYLVKPIAAAFDNGEQPVNISSNNIVWLNASRTNVIEKSTNLTGLEVAFLWGKDDMTGNLVKLPTGFEGALISEGEVFHAVIILGESEYSMPKSGEIKPLDPGSYFTSKGKSKHQIRVTSDKETVIYIRTNGKFTLR